MVSRNVKIYESITTDRRKTVSGQNFNRHLGLWWGVTGEREGEMGVSGDSFTCKSLPRLHLEFVSGSESRRNGVLGCDVKIFRPRQYEKYNMYSLYFVSLRLSD